MSEKVGHLGRTICKAHSWRLVGFLALVLAVFQPVKAQALEVVTSIKPVHSLVASVMAGVGHPYLIVKGAASPHGYALRPSDALALSKSDLVFWIGPDLEPFLKTSLETLAIEAQVVALQETPGLQLLPFREGGPFAEHGHEEGPPETDHTETDHDDADHAEEEEKDPHLWLDPKNAEVMVMAIAEHLSARDPENAGAYLANAHKVKQAIATLSQHLALQLAPLQARPFIVFHDGYQYFEARFGLQTVGSVTGNPDVQPGARRVKEVQQKMRNLQVVCIFSEPQFDTRRVQVVRQGTGAKIGQLDPLGSGLPAGPGLYETVLQDMTAAIVDCLS